MTTPMFPARTRPVSLAAQCMRESHVEHVLTTLAVLVLLAGVGLLVPQANRLVADMLRPAHVVAIAEQEARRVLR